MAALAKSKGIPHYATIQSYSNPCLSTRLPTLEENLCMVNLALAYGVEGILYWKYGPTPYYNRCPNPDPWCPGFDSIGASSRRSEIWYQVKDVVGPYIDKMGPIFASLEWKRAWKWWFTPPYGSETQAVYCNEYGQLEQEPLYLQVAEFSPINPLDNGHYFFLVNRRCLPDESISGQLLFTDFFLKRGVEKPYYITDMSTGTVVISDLRRGPGHGYDPPFGPLFEFSVPAGAGRLYRVTTYPPCQHGDANSDGSIDISDAIFLISYIFSGGLAPYPPAAGDANCDGEVDISDAVFLISYIFSGGLAPCPGCN
jgi:hypothetical protein